MRILILCLFLLNLDNLTAYERARKTEFPSKPNIVFILADDLGWNDVGFRNSFVRTPNIDSLAATGLELTDYHAQTVCSPSRSALMTGKYPSNNGLQHFVIAPGSKSCLPLAFDLLPQRLKTAGYTTKMVGKWHLGSCSADCLPTNRGFDEYSGVGDSAASYFNWTTNGVVTKLEGVQGSVDGLGTHLTVFNQRKAREMIMAHKDNENPLFMYVATSAPHDPYEVTDDMLNRHPELSLDNEAERERRKYLGLVAALDDLVGEVVQSLKDSGLYDNTVIVFASDNGGPSVFTRGPGLTGFSANNYPLRGAKGELFEGGSRVTALINSPLLDKSLRGKQRGGMMHITDWYPTLLGMAGVDVDKEKIDGVDQRQLLFSPNKGVSARKEMLIYLGDLGIVKICNVGSSAYRLGKWKLIYGKRAYYRTTAPGEGGTYKRPAESPNLPELTGDSCDKVDDKGKRFVGCLFNLEDDPLEQKDLYDAHPNIVTLLKQKIELFKNERIDDVFSIGNYNDPSKTEEIDGWRVLKPGFCEPLKDSPVRPVDPICQIKRFFVDIFSN